LEASLLHSLSCGLSCVHYEVVPVNSCHVAVLVRQLINAEALSAPKLCSALVLPLAVTARLYQYLIQPPAAWKDVCKGQG